MDDLSTLWQCPICLLDSKKPTKQCRRCGCHLLLLAKIKIISWQLKTLEEKKQNSFLQKLKKIF